VIDCDESGGINNGDDGEISFFSVSAIDSYLIIREIGPPLSPPFFSLTAADASARFLPAQTRSFPIHEKLAESALGGGRIYHITFPASRERRSVRG